MLKYLLLVLALVSEFAFGQVEVKELATRPNVTVRFLYAKAENPVASAVLFQGGNGNIGIFPNGTTRVENFLSGGAKRFTANGITVAIVDVPSDRRTLDEFRHTPEHAQDAAAVIAFLRQQSNLPVWAIGTSNGSLSAATAAELLKERGPDGIVLTSSVTRKPVAAAHPVTEAALDQITVPTLFVHHKNDACGLTPYGAISGVMASMKKAKKVDLITIEGGENRGNPCRTGYHQFLGIEATVTQQIADWIKRYQSSEKVNAGS
jgi:pimeloyl-ACP methyl ester carboxylesterase